MSLNRTPHTGKICALAIMLAVGHTALVLAQQPDWNLRTSSGPHARARHAMAYDSARGVTVLFGGYYNEGGGDVRLADTWEWDGTTWTQRSPAHQPSARYSPVMAYDSARQRVVLFGGYDGAPNMETWEWDGSDWLQGPSGPTSRLYTAMAYDSARGRCVLFSGGATNDTWEWDGSTWINYGPGGPSARQEHAMAFDSARGHVIVFGGYRGACLNDTWEWTGSAWTLRSTGGPSVRECTALACDSTRNKVVLFGGTDVSTLFADTWEWDGAVWTQCNPANHPAARYVHAMAYDSARGRVVLFGGCGGSYFNDTWEYIVPLPDINCEDLAGYDFGPVPAGTCSSEHTWTVTNEGTATLTGFIELIGTDAAEFEFTDGDGTFALDPNESQIVGVRFCPQSPGAKSATLHIPSNDLDENPCDKPLSGVGAAPDINCEDLTDYDWGLIPGGCSDVHYWSVTNEGNATLTGEVQLTGPDAALFEFTEGGGGFSLAPLASRTVGVRFCCDSGGTKHATLHIVSDDPDPNESPCDKALSGTCQIFLIGGAVYSDLDNPIGSGEPGVLINVDGDGGNFTATTSGMLGLWQIADVPPGTYTVNATKLGCTFQHVVGGVPSDPPPIEITVDQYHQAQNQSIQFLATCTPLVPDINCEDLAGFDFGSADVNTCTAEHTWTITNEGTAALTGTVWLSGVDPEQFQFVEGGDGFTLGPAESRLVKVRFCPDSVGSMTAILHIASNDPDENPCEKPLSGTGVGVPDLNCEDLAGYDFGSIVVGFCSAEHTWLVVNEGTAILSGTISLTGQDLAEFEFTRGDGQFDLAPGESRTVGIQFCPDSGGGKSAKLHIESNDPDENPCERTISGQGIPPGVPEINCEDLSGFDFGTKTVGFCTVEHTWTLVNEGTANLTGTILLAGVDAADFEFIRGGGGFGLGPGAQRIIGVRFCPLTIGAKAATLEIDNNDADENPCVIALSGTGEACAASRDLSALWPSYCDGDPKPVEINIVAPPGAFAIVLEDEPPTGWTASNISNGGVWDPVNHKVKWYPFFTPFPTQVSYSAEPPAGTQGSQCFAGVISIDGINQAICGDDCVDGPSGAFIPADQPQPPCTGCGDCSCATCEDRRVAICEMSGYACAWRRGCNDDIVGMARSAFIWMSGECYCWGWDGAQQQMWWFPSTCPPLATGCCAGREDEMSRVDGSAARELPASVPPVSWFPVSIGIQSPPGVLVVAIEDQPPAGWQVQGISDGGVWDEIHHKVKWGPYFAPSIPTQVSYQSFPPAGEGGEHCFAGSVCFDGINETIGGDACLRVGLVGDMNCDGTVDFGDINPFVLYLSNFANWQAAYENCPPTNGDINGDGTYPSFGDINPFVALLSGS